MFNGTDSESKIVDITCLLYPSNQVVHFYFEVLDGCYIKRG